MDDEDNQIQTTDFDPNIEEEYNFGESPSDTKYDGVNNESTADIEMTDRSLDNNQIESPTEYTSDPKTEQELSRKDFIQSLHNTWVGKHVKRMLLEFEQEKDNIQPSKPFKRGNVYCFAYFNYFNPSEPLITIGPDWMFSVAEIVLLNMFLSLPLLTFDHETTLFKATRIMMVSQNILFLSTVLSNPGMLP